MEKYEYQTYLGFEGTKEIDRVNNMKSFIKAVNERHKDSRAKIIPEIPKVLSSEYLVTNYNADKLKPYMVPVGLNYSTVDLVPLNLAEIGQFILVGKDNKPLDVGMDIFHRGLCLPSDNKMTKKQQDIIIEIIKKCFE